MDPQLRVGGETRSGQEGVLAELDSQGGARHPPPPRQHSEVTGICYPVRARSDWQVRVGTVIRHTDVPAFILLIGIFCQLRIERDKQTATQTESQTDADTQRAIV